MKLFLVFFTAATLLCGYFWLTDPSGSGMGLATGLFFSLGAGVALYNWRRFGSPFREK